VAEQKYIHFGRT